MNIQHTITLDLNEAAIEAVDHLRLATFYLNRAGAPFDSQFDGTYGPAYDAFKRAVFDLLMFGGAYNVSPSRVIDVMLDSNIDVTQAIEHVVQKMMEEAV